MKFFCDTNIPIGYTIIHDKWHPKSSEFIENNKYPIFWSNFVKQEYYNKIDDIIDLITEFLEYIIPLLENNDKDFINYDDFERFILQKTKFTNLDEYKKRNLLKKFWNKNEYCIGISTMILLNFVEYSHEIKEVYFERDTALNQILKLHDCGLNNFKKYLEYANKLYERGIHYPDCKIVVDAHDCGITHEDLIFVSNDEKLIKKLLEYDTSFLNIREFKSCN